MPIITESKFIFATVYTLAYITIDCFEYISCQVFQFTLQDMYLPTMPEVCEFESDLQLMRTYYSE